MTVEVTLFATLGVYRPSGLPPAASVLVQVPDGTTLAALAQTLAIPAEVSYVALVNGRDAPADCRLSEGDAVTLFPPLMGGAQ